jgi:hypothetical protein
LTQSRHWEFYSLSKHLTLLTLLALVTAPTAYSQSDEDILEMIRVSATKIFLEQASWTLPESFHNSGLAPSDKERLINQWANASANCLAEALATYANSTDVPLSDMVSDDGSYSLKGGSQSEYDLFVTTCIERAWEAVGASYAYD